MDECGGVSGCVGEFGRVYSTDDEGGMGKDVIVEIRREFRLVEEPCRGKENAYCFRRFIVSDVHFEPKLLKREFIKLTPLFKKIRELKTKVPSSKYRICII